MAAIYLGTDDFCYADFRLVDEAWRAAQRSAFRRGLAGRAQNGLVDYGREPSFGVFITPWAADPQQTVGLAVHAERVGLDLVTFQDHPYQPRFLDTWTLLSYVAARTERVTLAGDVLNLPLRLPAVLASSVASLDRLSGGRVALGLGAGGFWDAIVAVGGTRRTPGEAVDALEEAIGIIRERWDTERPGRHLPRGTVLLGGRSEARAGARARRADLDRRLQAPGCWG